MIVLVILVYMTADGTAGGEPVGTIRTLELQAWDVGLLDMLNQMAFLLQHLIAGQTLPQADSVLIGNFLSESFENFPQLSIAWK